MVSHVLYETGLTPKSNVTEIFERNFMPINGRQYNSRTHHRRNKNNTINYYTPDVTRFKQWINQRLPPDEGEIVDILTLQDYIQCVILAMFHEDFPNEKQKPALFYTSICYLGWRSSHDYNNIDNEYGNNKEHPPRRCIFLLLNQIQMMLVMQSHLNHMMVDTEPFRYPQEMTYMSQP